MAGQAQTRTEASRERVLECAETLFMEKGYEAIKLRHVADELGVRSASLYYYFPGGKQEMFQQVLIRAMTRIKAGLEHAVSSAPQTLEQRLYAAARYFLSQPKMDLFRMLESDLDHVDPEDRPGISAALYRALQGPLIEIFSSLTLLPDVARSTRGGAPSAQLMAGTFLSSIQAIHHLRADFRIPVSKEQMAEQVCDVLAAGVKALTGG
jgi:TetR/AcrR family transcriptional regulator, cholesterol catabolism regulator